MAQEMAGKSRPSPNTQNETIALSIEDVERLIYDPSLDSRRNIAVKVAEHYRHGRLSERQMEMAEQIFRMLVRDTEAVIRRTLSEQIKHARAPRDIVLALASDVTEVSIPMLECSEVLSEEDLVQIIQSTSDAGKHLAVSRRPKVVSKVSNALIETKNGEVVSSLLRNKGAELSENEYEKITEHFKESESVLGTMIERGSIPVRVVDQLSQKISGALYAKLSERHKDKLMHVEDVLQRGRDVATMRVIGLRITDKEITDFYNLMRKMGIPQQLMPIYALCTGNLNLFEVSVSRITGVAMMNIRQLVRDHSNRGFLAVYNKAHLPKHLYEATELLMEVLRDSMEQAGEKGLMVSQEFSKRILEELMERAAVRGRIENLSYIVGLVSEYAGPNQKH